MQKAPALGPSASRVVDAVVPLSTPRLTVLQALRDAADGVTVAELAGRLGLHVNTVREHLDALVDRGLATRALTTASGRGRPATRYRSSSVPDTDTRVQDYAGLAGALADHLARTSPDPASDAAAAGDGWGRELIASQAGVVDPGAERPLPSATAARRQVVALLDRLGFDPLPDNRARVVALRRCPLLEAARRHTAVVCGVHLGLVRGALDALGAPTDGTDLHPFSDPGACRLTLAGSSRQGSRRLAE